MTEKPSDTARRELDAVKNVQEIIRLALIALEEKTGKSIETVNIDTRNFSQLDVEIWLTTVRRQ